ncbi:hypothetical protein EZV76_15180 [Flagellimonas alvinocaridis]|uniref:Porin n=1 Tax=Flagellimonas alvinocaridis TaxID=2530200 RepID=A0A4S8RKJ1_9FLAO|nr:hypothetical protein [Allomuricauda alvinocaridis]THV57335.1 hypothetical protein EZV76_15180 [Allomuricauda alvinocaridis]
MKTILKSTVATVILFSGMSMLAQNNRDLDNFRQPDQRGVNVFEAPKDTLTTFENLKVRIGGSFALQFQGVDHENSGAVPLIDIGDNFNLATANLDLDVALYDGVNMHLRTYLSSRHHPEPYVKGGYIQIDKLDFVEEGFLKNIMDLTTIKIGHMENNYGDAHFRRSDNAQTLYNPFVGNLIMDAFTTEVGAEVLVRKNGFLGMVGLTNGKLNQAVDNPDASGVSFIGKLGYDSNISDDLRVRLTGSIYTTGKVANSYLYSADRAGSRYYLVLEPEDATAKNNFRSGRYDPQLRNEITALMFNPFVKYKGLEFFGTLEFANGKADAELDTRSANQYAGELIYRFGNNEKFYVGGRYNLVDAEDATNGDVEITRFQASAGWFMTKNILMKMEYVTQQHDGYPTSSIFNEGQFDGFLLEAAISF